MNMKLKKKNNVVLAIRPISDHQGGILGIRVHVFHAEVSFQSPTTYDYCGK